MQRIITLCVLMVYTINMYACNICGCSAMSGTPGILPKFQSHFIGIRQSIRYVEATHPVSLLTPVEQKSKEQYLSTEIWGRWYPHKRIQVFGFVPFNQFTKTESNSTTQLNGLGDVSLLINYLIIQTPDTTSKSFRQVWMAGSGIKLNTGKYQIGESPGFQLGSGTNDLQLYTSHTARYGNAGVLNELQYRITGTNPDYYKFGNKFNWSTKLFYWKKLGRTSILPSIGVFYEKGKYDIWRSIRQAKTGSQLTMSGVGIDIYFKNLAITGNCYLPIHQYINAGLVKEQSRIQINLIYNFNKKQSCN